MLLRRRERPLRLAAETIQRQFNGMALSQRLARPRSRGAVPAEFSQPGLPKRRTGQIEEGVQGAPGWMRREHGGNDHVSETRIGSPIFPTVKLGYCNRGYEWMQGNALDT